MNKISNQSGAEIIKPLIKKRLLKSEVARVLDIPRSEQLMDMGLIDDEVLRLGRYKDLEDYKRKRILNFNVIDLIFQREGVTWEYAYQVLGYMDYK